MKIIIKLLHMTLDGHYAIDDRPTAAENVTIDTDIW